LGFGAVGYVMRFFGVPFLPMVLGVVLGFMVESNYRRSLVLANGDHAIFIQDPVSLGLLFAAVALVVFSLVRDRRRKAKSSGINT
jgi:putative tricarboxylic transport membrane protein